ncbi:MAG: DUF7227 family protein [Pseudomonadota bacterium]
MKGEHRSSVSRFASAPIEVERSVGLAANHPAVVKGTTLFPTTVVSTWESPRFLVSGHNNPKLGKQVLKGPRTGWPIFHVTLEERATCPRSCPVWADCYGNAMPYARRHRPDEDFIPAMKAEIVTLARANRKGLLIRLHALGDFFSVGYVEMWAQLIDFLPQLHVFGYTARSEEADDEESQAIARAIRELSDKHWDRFSIRFSRAEPGPQRSVVVETDPKLPDVIVCPAQTGGTDACATCGLCWAPAARDKTIAFLRHGMKRRPAVLRTPREPKAPREPRLPKPKTERHSYGRPGRKLIGGLPGETKEDRAKRIALYAIDHPALSAEVIATRLGIPLGAVNAALAAGVPGRVAHSDRTRKPRQVFTPSPPPPATAEERIAAVSQAELDRIAKTYGAVIRPPVKELA